MDNPRECEKEHKMKRFANLVIVTIFLTAIFALLFTSGCAKKSEPKEIKIGVIAPLTGDAAMYGNDLKRGLEVAKEEINKKGTGGRKVNLIFEDSQADVKFAISAFTKLVNLNHVDSVIGDMFSSTTLAIAPLAQSRKIVLLSPTASSVEVPKTGDYIFSIYPTDSYDGTFISNFVLNKMHDKKVSVVYAQATAMVAVKDAFIAKFTEGGGQITMEQGYQPKSSDYRSILTKVNATDPEIIFIAGYIEEIVQLIKQAKEVGIKSTFITISTAYDSQLFSLGGDSVEGLLLSAPFYDEDSTTPEVVYFQKNYKSKYGNLPNVWAAYGYDALKILSVAYDNFLTNRTSLKSELSKIKNYSGITGKTTFLGNRSLEKELRVLVVREKRFVEYQK
jgi:branched-chain amino acid transport system substrate-binding protein